MAFLRILEQLRTPFWDRFFSLATYLGSEAAFVLLAVVFYWCVSKSRGLYLMTVGFFGTVANQFLKLACRVPRPWVRDPSFTIVESARANAGGYSFPSGHTQNAAGTFGALAMDSRRTWVRALLLALIVLTAFSRMYLGVHTPWDVGVSLALAAVLAPVLHPLFRDMDRRPRRFYPVWAVMLLCSGAYILYAACFPFPDNLDQANYQEGLANAWKLLGALAGMGLGYTLDLRYVRFRTDAPLPGQLCKCILGLALLLGLKEGLKTLLGTACWAGAVRYGIVLFFAAGIWPMTFPFFATFGKGGKAA